MNKPLALAFQQGCSPRLDGVGILVQLDGDTARQSAISRYQLKPLATFSAR
jgi:hypothetical protein